MYERLDLEKSFNAGVFSLTFSISYAMLSNTLCFSAKGFYKEILFGTEHKWNVVLFNW